MGAYIITNSELVAIANAIRNKKSSSEVFTLQQMPNAIATIGEPKTVDKESSTKIQTYIRTNTSQVMYDTNCISLYFRCLPNTTYTVNKVVSARFRIGYTADLPGNQVKLSGLNYNNSASSLSLTTDSNANYFVVYYYDLANDTLTENEIYNSIIITYDDNDSAVIRTATNDKYIINENKIKAIADAVRLKNGSSTKYLLNQLPQAILNIVTTCTINYYNGTTLLYSETVNPGSNSSYSGSTPTKVSDVQYTYTFSGWSKDTNDNTVDNDALTNITADRNVYACFTSTLRTYTVYWVNSNGTVLETDTGVPYGAIPQYNGKTPTSNDGDFVRWVPTISNVTGNITYTASFEIELIEPDLKYLIYTTNDTNNTMTITGLNVNQIVSDNLTLITIPDTINGYHVILG